MDVFDRIEKIRNDSDLSMQDFADSLSVNIGTIYNIKYKKLKGQPSPILLKAICAVYHINPLWLETGEGEMYDTAPAVDISLEVRDLMKGKPEEDIALISALVAMPDEWWQAIRNQIRLEMDRSKKGR